MLARRRCARVNMEWGMPWALLFLGMGHREDAMGDEGVFPL